MIAMLDHLCDPKGAIPVLSTSTPPSPSGSAGLFRQASQIAPHLPITHSIGSPVNEQRKRESALTDALPIMVPKSLELVAQLAADSIDDPSLKLRR